MSPHTLRHSCSFNVHVAALKFLYGIRAATVAVVATAVM
jgi:hypothetical protein